MSDIDLAELPPELRIILPHDGTLSTALEAYRLGPVAVDVRSQENIRLLTERLPDTFLEKLTAFPKRYW